MEIYRGTLRLSEPFDLSGTLACGAAFGWGRYSRQGRLIVYGEPAVDGWFSAPTYGALVRLRQPADDRLEVEMSVPVVDHPHVPAPMPPAEFVRWYFRMEESLVEIAAEISKDPHVAAALRLLPGLRLIRVEPVECLLAFLFSPQNRIPKIAQILNAVSRRYGRAISTEWGMFRLPPGMDRLGRARASTLASCGLRYGLPQARHFLKTFRRLSDQPDFFDRLTFPRADYETACRQIVSVCVGAGPKVADCVSLFSLGHTEAVPVDVHVFNSTIRLYRRSLRGLRAKDADALSLKEYRRIGRFYRSKFGKWAGYAQQYLFTAERKRRNLFKRKPSNWQS